MIEAPVMARILSEEEIKGERLSADISFLLRLAEKFDVKIRALGLNKEQMKNLSSIESGVKDSDTEYKKDFIGIMMGLKIIEEETEEIKK